MENFSKVFRANEFCAKWRTGYFLSLFKPVFIFVLFLGIGLPERANAVLVTINSAPGTDCPTCSSTSSLYTGLGTAVYTTASTIYGADEIGTSGVITSFAFQKTAGATSAVIDSVYIFMKEVSGKSTPTSLSLAGYTEVFKGTFTNSATTGYMTVTLATPFNYTGTANLSVIVVRNRYAAAATMSYRSHYIYGTGYNTVYRSNASAFWSSWKTSTSATTATLTNLTSYRPNVQFNINPFPACTGTPVGGSAIASTTSSCAGNPVKFYLTGSSLSSSITYNWDTSSSASGPWTLAGTTTVVPGVWTFVPPSGRTLYYRCRSTCSVSGASATSSTVSVAVSSPLTTPYSETFEGTSFGVNPTCASYTGGWSAGQWWHVFDYSYDAMFLDNHTPGGNKYLLAGYYLECGSAAQEFWFTPGISLSTGKTYRFSYWYVNDGYDYYNPGTGAYVGTAQTRVAMSAIGPFINTTETSYKQYVTDFSVASNGVYYLGIRVASTYNYGFAIDDIGLKELPVCNTATAADFVSVGKAGAAPNVICTLPGTTTLTISGTPAFSGLTFEWQRSLDPTFTTGVTTVATTKTATNSITVGGVYYYRCKVTCTATGLFGYSNVSKVVTTPITPPYEEDFETAVLGTNVPCAGSTAWSIYGDYFNTKSGLTTGYTDLVNHTTGGSKFLLGGYGLTLYTGVKDYWFTPAIKLTAGNTYEFSYWYLTDGAPGDPFELGSYVGSSQTAAAMTALSPDFVPSNTVYKESSANYTPATSGNYYFGIYVRGNGWYGLSIDDIGVKQLPPCAGKPSTAGITSATPSMLCSPGTVNFNLSSLPKVAGLSYQWWQCDAAGNLLSSISTPSTNPAFLSGTISTSSYYRCVVRCTYGTATDTTYSAVVAIPVGAVIPPYKETFETGTPGINMPCASFTYYFGYTWAWNVMGGAYTAWGGAALDNHTPGGAKYLIAGSDLGYYSGAPEYWFTPAIRFTAGKRYQFSYWYQTDGQPGCVYNLAAFMGNAQTPAAMTTALGSPFSTTTKTYQEFKHQFVPTVSGDFYIGIQKNQTNWGYGVAIDDIGMQEVPACSSPVVAGTIDAAPTRVCSSGGTTLLNLSGTTLATGLSYEWLVSSTPGGPYTTTGATTVSYNTDPLLTSTWYKVVVKCIASGAVDTSAAFKVEVGGIDPPYKEDFESTVSGDVPVCSDATLWSGYYYSGWNVCSNGTIGGPYKSNTPTGKNFLIGGYYLGSPTSVSEDNYWFTPGINLKTGYTYKLSFYYLAAYSSGYTAKMGVYIGKSQTVAAMSSVVAKYRVINNASYQLLDTVFNVSSDGIYYLGFRKSGANPTTTYAYEGVAFDDINLNYSPCDAKPNAGLIKSDRPSGTPFCPGATIKLSSIGATVSLVPGIKFQWQRQSISAPSGWSNVVGATDTVIKGDTLVDYEYRFMVICTNTNDTAFSPSYSLPQFPPHPPVSISPSTSPVSYCVGDTVKFTATNFVGGVYDWTIDSVVVPGWKFSDMGATEPGTYMVKVTSAFSPCPAYSNKIILKANDPGYTVNITKPVDSIICAGGSVLLSGVASKPGVTFQWRKNNVPIPGATSASYLVNTTGYYRLVATDGISVCAAVSRNVLITVKPNPPALITVPGGTTTGCANPGVRLDANLGGFSYEWLRGGTTVTGWTDSSQIITTSGSYVVKVRTSDGCVSFSAPVSVTILPSPVPIITKTAIMLGVSASFFTYQWIRNGVDIPGATASTYPLSLKGRYKVRVTDANGCVGESLQIDVDDNALSVDNLSTKTEEIKIYPNPTSSKVFIESPVNLEVEVKDAAGKSVLKAKDVKQIDLSKYADGIYLFIITNNGELIKQQRVTKTSQ